MPLCHPARVIDNYTDHAANERTYLAWVRTALAFMGFGLILERFDLFLESVQAFSGHAPVVAPGPSPREGGVALILLGVFVLGIASYRYVRFKRLIASPELTDFRSSRSDLVLVVIVATLAVFMLVYVLARAL